MTHNSLDFKKVEVLRRHMLLTTKQAAELMGVSRATYHNWVNGKPIRTANMETVKQVVRKLLSIAKTGEYPSAEIVRLTANERHQRLLVLMEQH
jgi:DNA-binding transcriptional regulator YiaG